MSGDFFAEDETEGEQGPLSGLDTSLAVGGINELDPAYETVGGIPNAFFMDPFAIPAAGIASGNLGPFGTPTDKGVNNRFAVSGITDFAHNWGAEIAALIAGASYGSGSGGGETGGTGYDPGGELYGTGEGDYNWQSDPNSIGNQKAAGGGGNSWQNQNQMQQQSNNNMNQQQPQPTGNPLLNMLLASHFQPETFIPVAPGSLSPFMRR